MLSFASLKKRGQFQKLINILNSYPDTHIFIDSGSFSLAEKDIPHLNTYFNAYKDFITQYGYRFDYATELDLDGLVPQADITRWRDALAGGNWCPIVPVWHEARGLQAWDEYCDDGRYPHLAFGSVSNAQKSGIVKDPQARLRFIQRAHRYGKTVHGFAETKVLTTLNQIPYDTVASTTWKSGERFGVTYIFDGGEFKTITKEQGKEQRKLYKKYFAKIGCDVAKIVADDAAEVRKANIIAWKKLSDRLNTIKNFRKALYGNKHTHSVTSAADGVDTGMAASEISADSYQHTEPYTNGADARVSSISGPAEVGQDGSASAQRHTENTPVTEQIQSSGVSKNQERESDTSAVQETNTRERASTDSHNRIDTSLEFGRIADSRASTNTQSIRPSDGILPTRRNIGVAEDVDSGRYREAEADEGRSGDASETVRVTVRGFRRRTLFRASSTHVAGLYRVRRRD